MRHIDLTGRKYSKKVNHFFRAYLSFCKSSGGGVTGSEISKLVMTSFSYSFSSRLSSNRLPLMISLSKAIYRQLGALSRLDFIDLVEFDFLAISLDLELTSARNSVYRTEISKDCVWKKAIGHPMRNLLWQLKLAHAFLDQPENHVGFGVHHIRFHWLAQ